MDEKESIPKEEANLISLQPNAMKPKRKMKDNTNQEKVEKVKKEPKKVKREPKVSKELKEKSLKVKVKKVSTKSKQESTKSSQPLSPPLSNNNIYSNGLTKDSLITGIRTRTFKKIAFLIGAGISVAAGIPDFRSPKIGLYAQVKEMGLPHPEDIFSLDYFIDNPQAFYHIAHKFLSYQAYPVKAHQFMKQIHDHRALMMVYTQNIDGLELIVGLPEKKVVQAHGHMRSAHCCRCHKEYSMIEFLEYASREEVWFCPVCQTNEGIIKPDIVFFGEKLPKQFDTKLKKLPEADLVIVMGTSLQVKPFSTLIQSIPTSIPLVVINRDIPKTIRENTLMLLGDIEEIVSELATELCWDISTTPMLSSTTNETIPSSD